MLHCLSSLVEDPALEEECRSELRYFQRMQVRSFGNDAALAEACRTDVEQLCGGEEDGGVLPCLHRNRPQLSAACRREEVRLDLMQVGGAGEAVWRERWGAGWCGGCVGWMAAVGDAWVAAGCRCWCCGRHC
jgi:hypothetical protein